MQSCSSMRALVTACSKPTKQHQLHVMPVCSCYSRYLFQPVFWHRKLRACISSAFSFFASVTHLRSLHARDHSICLFSVTRKALYTFSFQTKRTLTLAHQACMLTLRCCECLLYTYAACCTGMDSPGQDGVQAETAAAQQPTQE